MNDVVVLHVDEGADDLLHQFADRFLHKFVGRLPFEESKELASVGVFHQEIDVLEVVEDAVELDDVRMSQAVKDLGFSEHLLFEVGLDNLLFVHRLEGIESAGVSQLDQIHMAVGAMSQGVDYFEPSERPFV